VSTERSGFLQGRRQPPPPIVAARRSVRHPGDAARAPRLPALLLGLSFFALAALVWPTNLSRFVSLQWRLGSIQRVASHLALLLTVLGGVTILMRRMINACVHRALPTGRHLALALALVAGSTGLTIGGLELLLRELDLPFAVEWTPSENALAQFDPEIGWTYIPNKSAVQRFGAAQRDVPLYFDAIGARVGAPGTVHRPTAPTLILVGCSYTMGHGLPWEETFAGRLESTPGFPFQVVNLAVQAYGTDQSLLLLRRHLEEFNTKVVVYGFADDHLTRNANDDRRLVYPNARFLGTKPLFEVAADGKLVLRRRPHRYEDVWEPRVWSYVRLAWARWGAVPDGAVTRALVRDMRTLVEDHGASFIVLRWPGSHFSFDDPKVHEIDLGAMVPPEWPQWTIPVDGHPDARANAFVASVLAEPLRTIAQADGVEAPGR